MMSFHLATVMASVAYGWRSLLQVRTSSPVRMIHERSLNFYVPLPAKTCNNTAYPQTKINPGNRTLAIVGDWLWLLDEIDMLPLILHRVLCSNWLVQSAEEADLCYPSCTAATSLTREVTKTHFQRLGTPKIRFEVPLHKRDSFNSCSFLCLGPESSYTEHERDCSVEAPYQHGILWPQHTEEALAPWNFDFQRTTMLAFTGGRHRGHQWQRTPEANSTVDRMAVVDELRNEASRLNPAAPETVFTAHLVDTGKQGEFVPFNYGSMRTEEFHLDTWSLYAAANFSWQPHGDTPTRRAVFDSWMFGCVPVIDAAAAFHYSRLFNGSLWKNVRLENVFVVMTEGKESDGKAMLQMLGSMPADGLEQRRRWLRRLAPALQWSQYTPNDGDALLMALNSFRSG